MNMLHAHRFNTHYRIPADAEPGTRERLDRVLDEVVEHALEDALVHASIGEDEEICMRIVHVPFAVEGVESDSNLADRWALEILDALNGMISQGSSQQIVRYPTRRHAILELANAVVTGDCAHAWAWRQLDLWHGPATASSAIALKELIRALVSEPEAIVPVLLSLARGDRLHAFALQLDDVDWEILTTSALVATGSFPELLDPPSRTGESNTTASVPEATLSWEIVAGRILSQSQIVRSVSAAGKSISPQGLHALALLAVLETDPSKLRGDLQSAQCLVIAVCRRLEGAIQEPHEAPGVLDKNLPDAETDIAEGHDIAPDGRNTQSLPSQRPAYRKNQASREFDSPAPNNISLTDNGANPGDRQLIDGEGISAESRNDASQPNMDDPVIGDELPESNDQFPVRRQRGYTEYGGLLYLLNILEAHGIAEAAANDERLQSRLLRWVLHRLALALAPVSHRDSAALAFAGLTPESDPPSEGEDPPNASEEAAIHGLAHQVREILQGMHLWDKSSDALLLERVCHHPAEIIADPGWIEAHFPLDAISTEIRRSGLDANPDFIPWLGVVVKFVYE